MIYDNNIDHNSYDICSYMIIMSTPDEPKPWFVNCGDSPSSNSTWLLKWYLPQINSLGFINQGLTLCMYIYIFIYIVCKVVDMLICWYIYIHILIFSHRDHRQLIFFLIYVKFSKVVMFHEKHCSITSGYVCIYKYICRYIHRQMGNTYLVVDYS